MAAHKNGHEGCAATGAVSKACNWLKGVRRAVIVRLIEHDVVELEKQLRLGDQHGFFQNIKSVQLEETKNGE